MDLSSNEECPIDIQISRGAKIRNKPPLPQPRFLTFLLNVRFSWNLIYRIFWNSLGHRIWKNKLPPLALAPNLQFHIYGPIFMKLNI